MENIEITKEDGKCMVTCKKKRFELRMYELMDLNTEISMRIAESMHTGSSLPMDVKFDLETETERLKHLSIAEAKGLKLAQILFGKNVPIEGGLKRAIKMIAQAGFFVGEYFGSSYSDNLKLKEE